MVFCVQDSDAISERRVLVPSKSAAFLPVVKMEG
jgi:hypothetical protein